MFPFSGLIGLPNHEHPIGCLSRGHALVTEVKISYCADNVIKGAQRIALFYEQLNGTHQLSVI